MTGKLAWNSWRWGRIAAAFPDIVGQKSGHFFTCNRCKARRGFRESLVIWESDHDQTLPTHPLLGSFTNHKSSRETILEELKVLPPFQLAQAADFIHRLRTISRSERQAILDRTFGSSTEEEAAKMERAIEEGCKQIDERD